MDQKRKSKRRHLLYYLPVINRNTGEQIGHVADITPEGILLVAENPIPLKTTYQLRIMLPSDVLDREYLDVTAQAMWGQRDINPDFHATGFRHLNVAPEDRDDIEKLINFYGLMD